MSESEARATEWCPSTHFIGLVPMAFFSFPLYQVARLFPFVSSLDLREGQVTPLRGVTNFKLIQSGREASSHLCLPAHGLDPSPVSLLPTLVCVHVR